MKVLKSTLKYSVIAILQFFYVIAFPQTNTLCFQKEKEYNINYKIENYTITKLINNNIYLLQSDFMHYYLNKNSNYKLLRINLINNKVDSFNIDFSHIPESVDKQMTTICDFSIYGNDLIVSTLSIIIKFSLKKDIYVLKKIIWLPLRVESIILSDDHKYSCSLIHNASTKDQINESYIVWLNPKNGKIIKKVDLAIDGYCFSMLSGEKTAHSLKYSALSSISSYKIYVFNNSSMSIKDTLINDDEYFSKNKNIDFNYTNKSDFSKLRKFENQMAIIKNIKFINDTLLLVAKQYPFTDSLNAAYIDIWNIQNNKSILLYKNIKCIPHMDEDSNKIITADHSFFPISNSDFGVFYFNEYLMCLSVYTQLESFIGKSTGQYLKNLKSINNRKYGLRYFTICKD